MYVKDTHNKETSNNTGKFCESAPDTVQSGFCYNDLIQVFEGNLERDNNFLEKVNNKIVVDDLGTIVNINSSICNIICSLNTKKWKYDTDQF